LYKSFLDPYNQYTCGYFKKEGDKLKKAQERKMHLICEKLKLKSEDHLLDIGCGWGGFAKFASENYGCRVTGITISPEQVDCARKFTDGLPIDILPLDYRDLREREYSKISCVGTIEHVGYKNYRKFMRIVHKSLKNDGLFLLQTIGGLESTTHTDPWIEKYIFRNSMLPSVKQIAKASEGLLTIQDLHNLGPSYDKTLMAWYKNFKKNWYTVKSNYYNERFYRMWEYYLLSSAGSFRAKTNQLYQFVFSKNLRGEYISVR
jgi:cyclopropane-fatty-acyl-phospholipid synthase